LIATLTSNLAIEHNEHDSEVKPVAGKLASMLLHAKVCSNLSIEKLGSDMAVKILAHLAKEDKENNDTSPNSNQFPSTALQNHLPYGTQTSSPVKPAKKKLKAEASFGDEPERWTAAAKNKFDTDFMKMLVATGSSWNFVNNPEVRIFHQKWSNAAQIADRKVLSGRVLDNEVKEVEQRIKVKTEGKVATGQCDGWKNTAKKSVVTSMMIVENEVSN
jgi:hypothetical protein